MIIQDSRSKTLDIGHSRALCLVFCIYIMLAATAMVQAADVKTQAEANRAIQIAESLQVQGKTQEALSAYEEILRKYPGVIKQDEVLLKMARCYDRLGDDNSAIGIYLKLVSDDPDSIVASQAVSLMINLYSQRYRFDEVIVMSKNLLQQFPGTEAAAMALYRIAGYFYSQQKYQEAIAEYENFLSQFPKSIMSSTALNRLVSLYTKQGMFEEAESMLMKRLDQGDRDTYMLRQLALVYQKQGEYDRALELYKEITSASSNDIGVYEQIGELYAEMGDKEKALAEWSKITASAPGQYSRHQMLAYILKSHNFYQEAAAEYLKAIELQPLAYHLYTQLADLYIVRKQFDSAIDTYLNALIKLPINIPGRTEITRSMLELCELEGLCDRVVSRLSSYSPLSPDILPVSLTLADVYFHQDKFDDSLSQLKTIASRHPDKGSLLFDHAEILEREREFEHAIDFYSAVLDLFPSSDVFAVALLRIGQLRSRLHQPESALNSLNILMSHTGIRRGSDAGSTLPSAYVLAGDIYLEQMYDIQSALSMYKKAKSVVSAGSGGSDGSYIHEPKLDLKLAECYRLMGNYDVAEKTLDSVEAGYRSGSIAAQVARLRGDCYFSRGDFDNALNQYREVIKGLMNEDWINDCLDRIALISEYSDSGLDALLEVHAQVERLRKTGKYDEALKLCVSAIGNYASADRMQSEIGSLLVLKTKFAEAISAYEKLVQSDSPLAPEAQFRIAEIYGQRLNDPGQAIAKYSILIEKYPESVMVADARKRIRQLASERAVDASIP